MLPTELASRREEWRMIRVTFFNDPACPWGYSANPALRVLEWRYGDQLDWRLVVIGLRDEVGETMRESFDGAGAAARMRVFRDRYGMPFSLQPKARPASTGRGCRAIVAARLVEPGSEFRVMRALQLANFNTPLLLDDDEQLREALRHLPGLDADSVIDRLDDDEVEAAYARDKAEARTAAGTAIEAQGKASTAESPLVRYTAPSLVFERDARKLVAGGWQPELAYDLCIANLDPTLERTPAPETPTPLLDRFRDGLTTAELAALLSVGPDYVPDPGAAEEALEKLVAGGEATRVRLGGGTLWQHALRARGHARAGSEITESREAAGADAADARPSRAERSLRR
jgi:2-hydroxychromene-2-carboxylate isomerase